MDANNFYGRCRSFQQLSRTCLLVKGVSSQIEEPVWSGIILWKLFKVYCVSSLAGSLPFMTLPKTPDSSLVPIISSYSTIFGITWYRESSENSLCSLRDNGFTIKIHRIMIITGIPEFCTTQTVYTDQRNTKSNKYLMGNDIYIPLLNYIPQLLNLFQNIKYR